MPEWTVCPQCQLKHSRRPDGVCPRCKATLGDDSASDGDSAQLSEPEPGAESLPDVYDGRPLGSASLFATTAPAAEGVTLGARIGGAILVANALGLLVEKGLSAAMDPGAGPALSFSSPVSVLIDLVLGGMLLTGNRKGLTWAKVRVVLGGLLLPVIYLTTGNWLLAALQVAFAGGLALLLFGDPGRPRLAGGLVAAGLVLALQTVGLIGMATGTAPLASAMLATSLEGDPVDTVEGEACPWRVTVGGQRWYLRKAEVAKRENPLADRWLVWPAKDAHVIVIAERLDPGLVVDMEKFVDVVLENASAEVTDLQLAGREALHDGGTLVHATGTVDGLPVDYYYGLFASEPWIFQVVAFASRQQFPSVQGELRSIIDSFETP